MGKTYSFQEVEVTLSHPSLGVISTNGLGVGSVSVNMATETATASVASDGNVIINKIKDTHGNVELSIQQTSDVHKDLKRWKNYLDSAPTSEYALIKTVVTSKSTGEQDICTGGAIAKLPDKSFGSEVSEVSWSILCTDIKQNLA